MKYNFCVIPFIQIISNRYHAILSKFEWGPKTAQIIPGPFICKYVGKYVHVNGV